MIIDLKHSASPMITLSDADNCRAFSVSADSATLATLQGVLEEQNVGTVRGDHAWIDADAVRRLAKDESISPDWPERFGAMIAYAQANGWWDEERSAIRAHILIAPGA